MVTSGAMCAQASTFSSETSCPSDTSPFGLSRSMNALFVTL